MLWSFFDMAALLISFFHVLKWIFMLVYDDEQIINEKCDIASAKSVEKYFPTNKKLAINKIDVINGHKIETRMLNHFM